MKSLLYAESLDAAGTRRNPRETAIFFGKNRETGPSSSDHVTYWQIWILSAKSAFITADTTAGAWKTSGSASSRYVRAGQ